MSKFDGMETFDLNPSSEKDRKEWGEAALKLAEGQQDWLEHDGFGTENTYATPEQQEQAFRDLFDEALGF